MPSDFSIKFHGCRGSFPASGPHLVRYGGATPCIVVRAGTRTIVLDAGSGIVSHGQELVNDVVKKGGAVNAHIFITHLHLDHLIGLPFFTPMYIPSSTINVWGPRMGAYPSFEAAVQTLIHPPFFPVPLYEMQSIKHFRDISSAHGIYFLKGKEEPLQILKHHPSSEKPNPDDVEVTVECMRGYNHPKSGVLIYKVTYDGRSIVYATDTEGYVHGDQRLTDFAQDAEVLIHDAMYTKNTYISMPSSTQGYGHSTVEIAANVAKEAGVKKLFLFHHDPNSTDDDLDEVNTQSKEYFENSEVARDGLVYEI